MRPLAVGALYDSSGSGNTGLGAGWRLGDPSLYSNSQAISNASSSTAGSGGQPFAYWTASTPSLVSRVSPGAAGTTYAMKINNTSGSFASVTVSSTPAATATVWPGARLRASALMRGDALVVDTGQPVKGGAVRLRFFDTQGTVISSVKSEDFAEANYTAPDKSSWFDYDLGSVRPISALDMYLWDGYEAGTPRTYTYSVSVSADSPTGPWTEVVAQGSGRSWQHKTFEMIRARYVRVYAIACSVGDQFHICEMEVPIQRIGDEATAFDGNGRLAAVSDPDANVTRYRRDGSGRLASMEDASSGSVRTLSLKWAGNGDLSSLDWMGVDSSGGTLSERGAVTYSPSTASTITVYRKEGARSVPQASYGYGGSPARITRVADADGITLSITYDGSGRVWTVSNTGAGVTSTKTFTYGTSQVDIASTGSDGTSQAKRMQFDPAVGCQPTTVTIDPASQALATSVFYDGYGHVVRTVDPAGAETSSTVDPHGLVASSACATGSIVTSATYDADHLVTSTDAKGNVDAVTYDKPSWRVISDSTTVTDDGANGTVTQRSVYDTYGNRVEGDLAAATTPNILDNATFEGNVAGSADGWDLGPSGSVTWGAPPQGADKFLGDHVVYLTPSGGSAAWIKSKVTTLTTTTSAMAASAWVAGSGEMRLISVQSGAETVVRAVPFSGSATTLRRLSIEGTLTAGATNAKLQILSSTAAAAVVDNARLESSNAAGEDNQVENEGWERFTYNADGTGSPLDWWVRPGSSSKHITSGFGAVSGKLCGKIVDTDASSAGNGYFYSSYIPVRVGERYVAGGWIRPDGVAATSGGGVQIQRSPTATTRTRTS